MAAVDFAFKKAPSYRVASIRWTGPWSDESVHRHFLKVKKWAGTRHLRTGKWIFREPDDRKFEVAIEIKGKARSEGDVHLRTFRGGTVASVVYDPRVIEPRVVYHGLSDFLRWRKKDHTIRGIGGYREVYSGDPWADPKAYARTEVQILVKK